MNKKAEVTVKVIAMLFLFVCVLVLSFVVADYVVTTSGGGTSFSVNESVYSIYNISVNNSDVTSNITQLNITIPSQLSFVADSNGTSVDVCNFTNSSTLLQWENSILFLINNSEIHYFWFNASSSTPGNYNITVSTLNVTGVVSSTNLTLEINDTTAPSSVEFDSSSTTSDNHSQTWIFINMTAIDNVGIDTLVARLYNSSQVEINSTSGSSPVSMNVTGLNDGNYYVNATANDSAGNINNSVTRVITLGNAPTMVIIEPSDNASLSQTYLFINVTAVDSNDGVDNISLRLYNLSNAQINYTSNDISPLNMNVTGLPEGIYYINATANDTLGNEDSTSTISIKLDTSDPNITFSCDETDVEIDDEITCSCNASDTISGVNTLSYIVNPDTSEEGDFTTACAVRDFAGNIHTLNISYEVADGSSSSSSSSSTTTYWKLSYIPSEAEFVKGYSKKLAVKNRIRVTVNGSEHSVGVVYLTSTTATINITSDSQQASFSIGDEKLFEINNDTYYDVYVKLNSIESDKANVTVKYVHELIPDTIVGDGNLSIGDLNNTGNSTGNETGDGSDDGGTILFWVWVALGILVFLGVGGATFYYFYFIVYKEGKKEESSAHKVL